MRVQAASYLGLMVAANTLGFGLLAAGCSFGVSLDGIFGVRTDAGDSGVVVIADAGTDEAAGPPTVAAIQIAGGYEFTCALRVDGTVTCWGWNAAGQLGGGGVVSSSSPVLVRGLTDAVHIATGEGHACAVRKGATGVCWGSNYYEQLGVGAASDTSTPLPVLDLTGVAKFALGSDFSCALKTDQTVACWGDNTRGQLGDNTHISRRVPSAVPGLTGVKELAAARNGACALLQDGEVRCWGDNADGRLAVGSAAPDVPVPTKVPNLQPVVSLGLGPSADHRCAVVVDGSVFCWGSTYSGALGNAQFGSSTVPVRVVGLTGATSVAVGSQFTCATTKSGVSCWGVNYTYELALGDDSDTRTTTSTPQPAVGLEGTTQLALGWLFGCGLLPAGKIACWGTDVDGRLGRGIPLYANTPAKVADVSASSVVRVGAAGACANVAGGAVKCWGSNLNGNLGAALRIPVSGAPVAVPTLLGVTQLAYGRDHACALSSGAVNCWGGGYAGALGSGNVNTSNVPIGLLSPGPVAGISAGNGFTCALQVNGEVACTGSNNESQLGRPGGDLSTPALVDGPVAPNPLRNVLKLASGTAHSCAVVGTQAFCWGYNGSSQCGTTGRTVARPTLVAGLNNVQSVAAGTAHSCAILLDGAVQCWGEATKGQSGTGAVNGPTPVPVSLGGKRAKALALGRGHSCAILEDDKAYCWGDGALGQLGLGNFARAPIPTVVPGLSGLLSIAASADTTCATATDGSVYCWGDNSIGQRGDGTNFNGKAPKNVVGY